MSAVAYGFGRDVSRQPPVGSSTATYGYGLDTRWIVELSRGAVIIMVAPDDLTIVVRDSS